MQGGSVKAQNEESDNDRDSTVVLPVGGICADLRTGSIHKAVVHASTGCEELCRPQVERHLLQHCSDWSFVEGEEKWKCSRWCLGVYKDERKHQRECRICTV